MENSFPVLYSFITILQCWLELIHRIDNATLTSKFTECMMLHSLVAHGLKGKKTKPDTHFKRTQQILLFHTREIEDL